MEVRRRAFCRLLLVAAPLASLAVWQPPPPARRVRIVRAGLPRCVFRKLNEGVTPTRSWCYAEVSDDDGLTWRRA